MSLDIPHDFPLTGLLGQELIQVCIGQHHVRLNFAKRMGDDSLNRPRWGAGAAIDIESGFELSQGDRVHSATNDVLGSESACLTALLGQNVTSVKRLEKNELMLSFSTLATLRLRTDPIGFESYHLHIEGQSVDVTSKQQDV